MADTHVPSESVMAFGFSVFVFVQHLFHERFSRWLALAHWCWAGPLLALRFHCISGGPPDMQLEVVDPHEEHPHKKPICIRCLWIWQAGRQAGDSGSYMRQTPKCRDTDSESTNAMVRRTFLLFASGKWFCLKGFLAFFFHSFFVLFLTILFVFFKIHLSVSNAKHTHTYARDCGRIDWERYAHAPPAPDRYDVQVLELMTKQ